MAQWQASSHSAISIKYHKLRQQTTNIVFKRPHGNTQPFLISYFIKKSIALITGFIKI